MTKKLLTACAVLALTAVFAQSASAAGVYVSPSTATKNVGETVSISVGVAGSGSKVFAVEGALSFDKLTCVSIVVADGVTSQTSPSCANPKFLLGIPSGTTGSKTLFTVVAKAPTAGEAKLSVGGVDVIGEGSSLSTAGAQGVYTVGQVIKAEVKTEAKPEPTPTAPSAPDNANKQQVAPAQTAERIETEIPAASTSEDLVETSTISSSDEPSTNGTVLAGYEEQSESDQGNSTMMWIIVAVVILAIICVIVVVARKGKNKSQ